MKKLPKLGRSRGVNRTLKVHVTLNRTQHRLAHRLCHQSAQLWNLLIDEFASLCQENPAHAIGAHPYHWQKLATQVANDNNLTIHASTKQAIGVGFGTAIVSARQNRKQGRKANFPHKKVGYRPLEWSVMGIKWDDDGEHLILSNGYHAPRLRILIPDHQRIFDQVPVRNAKLSWDFADQKWHLSLSYDAASFIPELPYSDTPEDAVIIADDEGETNHHSLAYRDNDGNFHSLVINGRKARSTKRYRNKAHAQIATKQARCKEGSRRWRKLQRAKNKITAKTNRRNRDLNHKVASKVERFVRDAHAKTGKPVYLAIGDVAGVENNTKKERRVGRVTRGKLSQWQRGEQESLIHNRLRVPLNKVPEHYTSQTCPHCGVRNKVPGRTYQCKNCSYTAPRDVVGAINILSVADNGHGKNLRVQPSLTDTTDVSIEYARAVEVFQPRQSALASARNLAAASNGGNSVGQPHMEVVA